MDYDEFADNILSYVKKLPADKRVSEEEYQRRLSLCRECESLRSGMCLKCGCYVELRAAKTGSRCPDVNKKW
ncbi:MAG: hypothetical protein IJ806_11145 [Ruminococcus sp.]|nr:hypothetical protein [Ruminococcus sp.]